MNVLYAQNQNNFWFFGNEAGIDFSSGAPVSITTGQMLSIEGCASVSDLVTGNLLFYSNGLQIWNANHVVMPNGNGLLGGASTSSTQGVLIVPFPNNPGRYFLFTVDESIGGAVNGFRYSVVNMNLNGGLGDVVSGQKNILIQNNVSERLAVAVKGDSTGYWVMIHERGNNLFKAYLVDQNGVNTAPVISAVGAIHTTVPQTNGDETMGAMKFNHAFNKVAVAIYAGNKVQVFDFNNCSGIVSNPITINTIDNPYGLEFSPDNSRLYYDLYYNSGFNGAVYQVNMLAPNPATSSVLVGVSSSFNFQCMGALQLAPDGKIYISINSESWLSAINSPNSLGVSCGFVDQAVTLQQVGLFPSPGLLGLPQYVPFVNGSITPSLTSVSVCQNQLPFLWNGNSYNAPGNYSVVLTNIAGCDSIANLNLSVVGSPSSTTNLTICSDQLPFVWNGQSLNSPGTYTAILNNITGCDSLATLNLFVSNTSVSTTNLNLCADQLPIIWNSQSIADSGTYTAVLLNGTGCDSIATLVLSVNAVDTVSSSISLCRSQLPYLWNGISIFNTGEYVYSMTASTGCDSVLTLNVVIDPDTLVYEIITSGSCIGDGTEFDLNSSSDILSILWNFGDPQTTSDTNSLLQPSYFYTNVGSYPVTAFISTACKSDTLRTEVEIVDCDTFDFGCNIFLPNAFTPNNDQLNERYFPVFDCPVDNFLFTIFNRWGQVVFSTTDTLSLGWDGIYDDLDCPMGVYVAKLKVKFVNGQEADLLRVLTLLR